MRAIDYALRQAATSLVRSRGAGALAVVAIALAMVVLGVLLLLTTNAREVLGRWTSAAELSVYLRDDATSEQRGAIEAMLDESAVVTAREYVSKPEALTRFRREFADLASLTSDFDDNPFPASLEVRVRPEAERDGRADALVRRVAAMAGVADVRYDREWLAKFSAVLGALRGAGFALVLLMGAAAALTVTAVVRLGLHARRDEIEIMQLVGSPYAYIRGPFIAEGLLQGGLGALIALAALWVGVMVVRAWWGPGISTMLGGALEFLPVRLSALLVAGGMAVGGLGGFAASRHV
jgi:cell division transport system permease protein